MIYDTNSATQNRKTRWVQVHAAEIQDHQIHLAAWYAEKGVASFQKPWEDPASNLHGEEAT